MTINPTRFFALITATVSLNLFANLTFKVIDEKNFRVDIEEPQDLQKYDNLVRNVSDKTKLYSVKKVFLPSQPYEGTLLVQTETPAEQYVKDLQDAAQDGRDFPNDASLLRYWAVDHNDSDVYYLIYATSESIKKDQQFNADGMLTFTTTPGSFEAKFIKAPAIDNKTGSIATVIIEQNDKRYEIRHFPIKDDDGSIIFIRDAIEALAFASSVINRENFLERFYIALDNTRHFLISEHRGTSLLSALRSGFKSSDKLLSLEARVRMRPQSTEFAKGPFYSRPVITEMDLTEIMPEIRKVAFATIKDGKLSFAQKLQVAYGIADSLSLLHAAGITHRRVKSENIRIDENLDVTIYNYGFGALRKTTTTAAMFKKSDATSIRWRAPEAFGREYTYAPPADIYGFGVVLWELYTMVDPYSKIKDERDVLRMIELGNRLDIPAEVEPEIRKLISSCWDKDPNVRPTAPNLKAHIIQIAEHRMNNLLAEMNAKPDQDLTQSAYKRLSLYAKSVNTKESIDGFESAQWLLTRFPEKGVNILFGSAYNKMSVLDYMAQNPGKTLIEVAAWVSNRFKLEGEDLDKAIEEAYLSKEGKEISYKWYSALHGHMKNTADDEHTVDNWMQFLKNEYPKEIEIMYFDVKVAEKVDNSISKLYDERFSRDKELIVTMMEKAPKEVRYEPKTYVTAMEKNIKEERLTETQIEDILKNIRLGGTKQMRREQTEDK